MASLRPRSVYDVLAAISFAALVAGGTAYAAATVTGADVVNESLTGTDVKNGTLAGADVLNESLTGTDVKNGSLTGADVAESSLNLRPAPATPVRHADSPTVDACAGSAPVTGKFCGLIAHNAWFNYGNGFQPAGFFRDPFGIIHVHGHVAGGGTGTIFILPPGYRPTATRLFTVQDNAGTSYVKVFSDGRVTYRDSSPSSTAYLSLDGIDFRP